MLPYTYHDLLAPLQDTREGRKLAMMARQIKIEQSLLAEIMFNGNERYPELDFYLEENRCDLTIRKRELTNKSGKLVEWVEAKMCWTDSLARYLTRRTTRPDEYCNLLRADAEKQIGKEVDPETTLTLILFAVHFEEPKPRQKYNKDFKNRIPHTAADIKQHAEDHVRNKLAAHVNCNIVEEFAIALDVGCELLVFVLRPKDRSVT